MWCKVPTGMCIVMMRSEMMMKPLAWTGVIPWTENILSYLKPNSSKFSQGESGKPKSVQDTKAESGNRGVIYI